MSLPIPFKEFQDELAQRESEIASLLPSSIGRERFVNTAIVAVKKNPDLLLCSRRSLHNAVISAAMDGLIPDGKEGVILPRKEKVKKKNDKGIDVEVWIEVACWQPMAFGIRKRARELDGLIIDAQVVHEKDKFVRKQGDSPSIEHEPAQLGTPRGKKIGVYAIFKKGDVVVHREVMDLDQIAAVKSISKQPNGLMWKNFEEEAWRKSVVRRGIKTVPCSEKLQTIIERFDDLHDVSGRQQADRDVVTLTVVKPTSAIDLMPPPAPEEFAPETLNSRPAAVEENLLGALENQLEAAQTEEAIDEIWSANLEQICLLGMHERERVNDLYEFHVQRVQSEEAA